MHFAGGIIFILFVHCTLCDKTSELISVITISRHGDRSPVAPYPNDPYRNETYWPQGYGQLINEGKQRHYELGKWLRNRYDGFLPKYYFPKDIYVRSIDKDRCLTSAATNLAGLYPPRASQIWNPEIQWQPIPVHTVPESADIIMMKKECRKHEELLEKLLKSPSFSKVDEDNRELYKDLTIRFGINITNFVDVVDNIDALKVEKSLNFTLPEWTRSVDLDHLKHLAVLYFQSPFYTTELARLKAGPLFQQVINHFDYFITGKTNPHHDAWSQKFIMLFGQDKSITGVLNSLQLFEPHWVPYAATLLFELRRNQRNNKYFVNLLYKNSSELIIPMTLKNCSFDCEFNEFVNVLKPVTLDIESWEKECNSK